MELRPSISTGHRVLERALAGRHRALALGAALASLALVGCGQAATSPVVPSSSAPAPSPVASTASVAAPTPVHASHRPRARRGPSGLPYSTASAHTVQTQPPAGSCHAHSVGLYSRPDPRCTPGALNPAVTQATIGHTICQSGWTRTVRPPESVTETEKAGSMAAYGDSGPMSAYEYDHFVPLELGGAVNDRRNLWPEPGATPNPKDAVEDELNKEVCDGQMTLAQAQHAIATNWTSLTSANPPSPATTTKSTTSPSAAAGQCSLTASYSDRYHDYDVYVHSNQPDKTVTVTDTSGHSATWHTDASGYADVYFRAPANATGETVTARVGTASCQGVL